MIYGYIRVSTREQGTDTQKFEILSYAYSHRLRVDKIIEETASSVSPYTSRQLGQLITQVKKDDMLIVTEFSRFGRSILEVMEILNQLMKNDVKVCVTKGAMEIGNNIQSKVLAFAFSLAAEIERELISQRTKEALARLKSEGKHLGRPRGSLSQSKLDGQEKVIDQYLSKGISITSLCKLLDVAPSTFYGFCKTRNIDLKRIKKN